MKFYKALRTRRMLGIERREEFGCRSYIVHLWLWTWTVRREEIPE
jgi:hypothetical protein